MGFTVKKGRECMHDGEVVELIHTAYWAKERPAEVMKKALDHSVCFGAFLTETDEQVGLVRVITDYATSYYICDVIVREDCRGLGIGKALMDAVDSAEEFAGQRGLLITETAHGLYAKYGFELMENKFMTKKR